MGNTVSTLPNILGTGTKVSTLPMTTGSPNTPVLLSNPAATPTKKVKNIYGTGKDLSYAQGKLGIDGYNYVDTGAQGYVAPSSGYTADDLILGGVGTTGGVVNGGAAGRLWGVDSQGTNGAIDYYANSGKVRKNVYGATVDLDNAKPYLGADYNYIDLTGYNPGTFSANDNDLILGGAGVTGAVNAGNANRIWGQDREATKNAIMNYFAPKTDPIAPYVKPADIAPYVDNTAKINPYVSPTHTPVDVQKILDSKADLTSINNQAKTDATNEYLPQYNSQVDATKAALARKLLALEQSKTGINQRYDDQIKDLNLSNEINQHTLINNLASRGLGRSTFFTSGISGLNDKTNRLNNNVNTVRNGELGNIDSNKVLEQGTADDTLKTLAGDKDTRIASLARQYAQQQLDRFDKNKQFDYTAAQDTIKNNQVEDSLSYEKYQDAIKNNQWDKNFSYQQWQDSVKNKQIADAAEYAAYQDKINNKLNQDKFDYGQHQDGITNEQKRQEAIVAAAQAQADRASREKIASEGNASSERMNAASNATSASNAALSAAERAQTKQDSVTNNSTYKTQVGAINDLMSSDESTSNKFNRLYGMFQYYGALDDDVSQAIAAKAKYAMEHSAN